MQIDIKGKDLQTLIALYSQEIDLLKEKLLNGESWENLRNQRRNITELAIAIHREHQFVISENLWIHNPAEFPRSEDLSGQPTE